MRLGSIDLKVLPKIDGYVTRSVIFFMVMCTLSVCFLVSVIDAFQRMDEFVDFSRKENYGLFSTIYLVITYYLCVTPQYFIQFMVPFVSMISGIVVVSVMSSHKEFTALRSSGLPLQRVIVPLLFWVFVIGLGVFLLRDSVLPFITREAHAVNMLMKPKEGKPIKLVIRDDASGDVYIYMMGHFNSDSSKAHNFRLEIRKKEDWEKNISNRYECYTDTDARLYGGEWSFSLNRRHFMKGEYSQLEMDCPDTLKTDITPAMLEQQTLGMSVMTSSDLSAFRGDISKEVELWRRRAAPLAGVAIMLVGISLILRREREDPGNSVGRVKSIVMALLVCVSYYMVQNFLSGLAEADVVKSYTAAWLPVVLYSSWGSYSFYRVNL